MDGRTIRLVAGSLLFVGAALALYAASLPDVGFPTVAYIVVGVGLFAGVYLVGLSHPDRPI